MAGLRRNDNLPACATEIGDTCKKILDDGADITKEYTFGLQEGQAKKTKICLNVNPVSLVKILPWGEKIAGHSLVQQGNDWVLENDNSIGPKFWCRKCHSLTMLLMCFGVWLFKKTKNWQKQVIFLGRFLIILDPCDLPVLRSGKNWGSRKSKTF